MKLCSKCRAMKPATEFHKRVASLDGLAHKCKSCANANSVAWRERNPGAHQRWYQENQERKRQYWARWSAANKDRIKTAFAIWAKSNRPRINAGVARWNAAKMQATPVWANETAIRKFYAEAARLTKETGIQHQVDHIVPLQGRTVRGLHWEGNLQVIPKLENISKKNRYWPHMPC